MLLVNVITFGLAQGDHIRWLLGTVVTIRIYDQLFCSLLISLIHFVTWYMSKAEIGKYARNVSKNFFW